MNRQEQFMMLGDHLTPDTYLAEILARLPDVHKSLIEIENKKDILKQNEEDINNDAVQGVLDCHDQLAPVAMAASPTRDQNLTCILPSVQSNPIQSNPIHRINIHMKEFASINHIITL
jgi:hypothetical protein